MTPSDAAAHFAKSAAALRKNLLASERQTVKDAQRHAIIFSSGGISTKHLAAAGHPYARRAPNSAYDPGIINKQGGVFVQSWRIVAPVVSSSGIVSQVINVDPKSVFMAGTRVMISRPVQNKVIAAVQPERLKRTQKAVMDAFYRP